MPSEKRKALDLQSTTCIFVEYLDVKGYILLEPSTHKLIIECNVHFEENLLHALSETHVDTFIPLPTPKISDNKSTHSDNGLDLSIEYDSKDDDHIDDENANVEPPQMPKWE